MSIHTNHYLEKLILLNKKAWEDNVIGYILADLSQNILTCNNAAMAILNLATDKDFKVRDIFNVSQDYVSHLVREQDKNILNDNYDALNSYKVISIIHDVAENHKTPVQFVGFWPYNGEYKSLLFHCIPVFDDNSEVIALSYFISEYSMWGIQEYLDINEKKHSNFLTIVPKGFKFEIVLTTRQHEILFLLLSGISQRMSAHILGISYGTISRVIHEYICVKFGIENGDFELLIRKALELGYSKYIPQSLCRPCIIVLNPDLIVKYFSYRDDIKLVKNIKKIR